MKKYLLIRMMQTVAIILFAANVSAQNQNVVISVRNIPVRTALTQIRQAANVHFVYEEKNINSQQTVTLNYPQGTSLSTLLNNLCKQIGLTYEINESVILLYPAQKQTTTHDIHILLLERGNKQPLPMATCVLNPLGAYAATDMEGKAVLKNVPTGKYILNISYVGFETVQREINVEQNLGSDDPHVSHFASFERGSSGSKTKCGRRIYQLHYRQTSDRPFTGYEP